MAVIFNKWFSLAACYLFFFINGSADLSSSRTHQVRTGEPPHPFHVSVVEINHNAADKTLEISCKIFTDDFEKVLAQNYKTKTDLINPPNKAAMDSLVKKYLFSHFSLKANGKPAVLNYIGFENEKEAAYGYIEVENITSVSKIEISSNIMYDMFDDQMNIFHVIVNGNRKSNKLNYPEKELTVSF